MEIVIPQWAIYTICTLIAILGAFSVQRYIAYRNACVKFKASVLATLSGLYPHPTNWPNDGSMIDKVLKNRYAELQAAVTEFNSVVPWMHKKSFHRAWLRYCSPDGEEYTKNVYHHYIPFDDTPNPKTAFHNNIQALLKYADRT